jgi:DNA gyrase subunit A
MYTRNERIVPIYVEDEMRDSYISYAMSVIVGRALPDARDGLKPVHRRILYAMRELGLEHNKPFKKAARIVGECLGKYHPHGDIAVYDALIRMAQDFSLRYPLVEGQGNVGSVDGDSPAAMRYVEARLATITDSILVDIDKQTVDFMPNFDETLWEPTVLPACLPNLLVNGSSGIAVGMATNIPPHNLSEVVDAISLVIDNPDCSIEELMRIIKGPDFPTGGIICGRDGIKESHRTGRGLLKLRAKAAVESLKSGKEQIVVTELPYQVNKASLIESIATLVQDKRIEGISDLRDESDKEGVRIVVELKRDQEAELVLNRLFKHTQMETTFGVIMLALVEGRPRVLNLKQMIEVYIDHRKEVICRRTRFELDKAQNRAHILEGLKKALAHLDEVIKTIKKSKSVPEAKESLIKGFDLSPQQAQAILEMQLQRLTHLEREKIDEEYLDLIKRIQIYKSILASEKKVFGIIKEELLDLKKRFGDERRTKIAGEAIELEVEDLIAEEDVVITISHSGYIKRLPVSSYRKQRRGGKGVAGMETREEDFVEHLFIASTHDYILIFTDKGKLYWLKVHEIPIGSRTAKGKAIVNLLQLSPEESISSLVPVRKFEEGKFLGFATRQGIIKKTALIAFSNPRKAGIIAITLENQDELIGAELTDGKQELLLATKLGKAIRFRESQVRDMGRTAKGVKGITLSHNDRVIAMEVVRPKSTLLTVTSEGFGKRTQLEAYRLQSRGGKGIINVKVTKRNGEAVAAKIVSDTDELMVITFGGMIVRCPIKDIRTTGRNVQGVKIIKLEPKDKVASLARLVVEEE